MTAFERHGVKTSEKAIYIMSTDLSRPGLARSAHHERITLLKGYVSMSSAALNPLTITQLACESARGRSWTTLCGPAHQLALHMCVIISNNINYGTQPGYGTVRGTLPLVLGKSSL